MVPGTVSNSSKTGLILQGGRAERRERQQDCDLADSARTLALEQGEQSSDGIMGQPQSSDCQASPQR